VEYRVITTRVCDCTADVVDLINATNTNARTGNYKKYNKNENENSVNLL